MVKILISFLLISLFHGVISAQVVQQWDNVTPSNSPYGSYITLSTNGYLYQTYASGTQGNFNISLRKYTSSGIVEWERSYSSSGNADDIPYGIAIDNAGNIILIGTSVNLPSTSTDYMTIKFSPEGVQLWAVRYNGTANINDYPKSVAIDNSNNVYVTGISYGHQTDRDLLTVKYNSEGIEQWTVRYNNTGAVIDEGVSVKSDAAGNIYVAGFSDTPAGRKGITFKYNSAGVQLWIAFTEANFLTIGCAVSTSGNLYLLGLYYDSTNRSYYSTLKYNSSGVQQWKVIYGGSSGNDTLNNPISIGLDNLENIYVTGYSQRNGWDTSSDYATVKYNSLGNLQWVVKYNDDWNDWDKPRSMYVDAAGNCYVTGYSWSGITNSTDITTIKYNSNGAQLWLTRYGSPNSYSSPTSLAVASSGDIYVSGAKASSIVTIKYSQTTGISLQSSSFPGKFILNQNYPNPFNPVTQITFALPTKEFVSLKIYDNEGKEVKLLVNDMKEAGYYSVTFDAKNLPSGIYFYQLTTDKFSDVKKMVVIK